MGNQDTKPGYIMVIFSNAYNEYLKIAQDKIDLLSNPFLIDKVTDDRQ